MTWKLFDLENPNFLKKHDSLSLFVEFSDER